MKTNKLPKSVWTDTQAAGSQIQSYKYQRVNSQLRGYMTCDNSQQPGDASNDASYESELSQAIAIEIANYADRNKANSLSTTYVEQAIAVDGGYKKAVDNQFSKLMDAKKQTKYSQYNSDLLTSKSADKDDNDTYNAPDAIKSSTINDIKQGLPQSSSKKIIDDKSTNIPERVFMNGLIKHTGIALAIIIPLAAFSAYAAPTTMPSSSNKNDTATLVVKPTDIIYKSTSIPATVDTVDLERYTGTWYEIGPLPMYFQRNCARDVTATYTAKDAQSIVVTNKCIDNKGAGIVAEGLAKPIDSAGSKLKVTFLPSWIRWLPVGRADYWVLARDANYQTALVGTPDKDYLWLIARSPNITQQTYAKYRQIAQQQGYELKEFKLTPQSGQTVNLVP